MSATKDKEKTHGMETLAVVESEPRPIDPWSGASSSEEETILVVGGFPERRYSLKSGVAHSSLHEDDDDGPTDISSLSVSSGGIIETRWKKTLYIQSRIVEVGDQHVVISCLIDKGRREFEDRLLNRSYLEGVCPIEEGRYILMEVKEREGEVLHKFRDGEGLIDERYFQTDSIFQSLEGLDFGQPQ